MAAARNTGIAILRLCGFTGTAPGRRWAATRPDPSQPSVSHTENDHDPGLAGTHFHDLRHTGNVLTAGTGATLRELMERMGQ